ncbi:MAG: GTP-binding protein [Methanobacteriota archaeon]|nr:MAG: GTP-binding protein [Euryarchaeota archaeon]
MSRDTYQVKLVLIGSDRVGKTSIRRRYLGLGFKTSHIKTLGSDFSVKSFDLEEGEGKAVIWDLAGEAYRVPRAEVYLRGAAGILAIFDVTNPSSLENLKMWAEWAAQAISMVPFFIVGNKIDLESERKVSREDMEKMVRWIKENFHDTYTEIKSFETSAMTGEGINQAFEELLRYILVTKPSTTT